MNRQAPRGRVIEIKDKTNDAPASAVTKKTRKPRPKLTHEMLFSSRGLSKLKSDMHQFMESKDFVTENTSVNVIGQQLGLVMNKYSSWAHGVAPFLTMEDFIQQAQRIIQTNSGRQSLTHIELGIDEDALRAAEEQALAEQTQAETVTVS